MTNKLISPIATRRTLWLLGVGVLLVAIAVGYIRFFLIRPMGEGPAGPVVDSTLFTEAWS